VSRKSAEELFRGMQSLSDSMVGMVYRHVESGVEYVVESVGLDEEDPSRRVVTYRELNTMHVWTRWLEKFVDGRYEPVKNNGRPRDEVILRDEEQGSVQSHRRLVTELPFCFAAQGTDGGPELDQLVTNAGCSGYDLRRLAPVQWHRDPSWFISSDQRYADPDGRSIRRETGGFGQKPEMYHVTITFDVKVYQESFASHMMEALRSEDTQRYFDRKSGAADILKELVDLGVETDMDAARRLAKHPAVVKQIHAILQAVDGGRENQNARVWLEMDERGNKWTGHDETFLLWAKLEESEEGLFEQKKHRIKEKVSSLFAAEDLVDDGHLFFGVSRKSC